jgi:hypothetical protein
VRLDVTKPVVLPPWDGGGVRRRRRSSLPAGGDGAARFECSEGEVAARVETTAGAWRHSQSEGGEGVAAWPAINGPWCPSVTGDLKRIGNGRETEGIESVSGAGASLIFDGRGLKEGRAHDTGETGRRRQL